jgi:hypothetical protein
MISTLLNLNFLFWSGGFNVLKRHTLSPVAPCSLVLKKCMCFFRYSRKDDFVSLTLLVITAREICYVIHLNTVLPLSSGSWKWTLASLIARIVLYIFIISLVGNMCRYHFTTILLIALIVNSASTFVTILLVVKKPNKIHL